MLGLVFTLLGLIAIGIFAMQVYRSASETGRNPAFWAVITCVVGFGGQFILPVLIGITFALIMLAIGTAPESIGVSFGLGFVIDIICVVLSVVGMFQILKHTSSIRDDLPNESVSAPPPPPTFE